MRSPARAGCAKSLVCCTLAVGLPGRRFGESNNGNQPKRPTPPPPHQMPLQTAGPPGRQSFLQTSNYNSILGRETGSDEAISIAIFCCIFFFSFSFFRKETGVVVDHSSVCASASASHRPSSLPVVCIAALGQICERKHPLTLTLTPSPTITVTHHDPLCIIDRPLFEVSRVNATLRPPPSSVHAERGHCRCERPTLAHHVFVPATPPPAVPDHGLRRPPTALDHLLLRILRLLALLRRLRVRTRPKLHCLDLTLERLLPLPRRPRPRPPQTRPERSQSHPSNPPSLKEPASHPDARKHLRRCPPIPPTSAPRPRRRNAHRHPCTREQSPRSWPEPRHRPPLPLRK